MPVAKPPVVVVPTAAEAEGLVWSYTTTKPAEGWSESKFDDSGWKKGESGFGTRGTPGGTIRTEWNTREIWLRREVELDKKQARDLVGLIHHDEDFELYINGVLAARRNGYTTGYDEIPLTAAGLKALRPGKNVIAIHCRQTGGGQYIDAGFVRSAK